jgi:hypothetical protein
MKKIMSFISSIFSLFRKSKSKRPSKNTKFKQILVHAQNAERNGELGKALQFYEGAMSELEIAFKHSIEGKYYRSKNSEIRFTIDNLKKQIEKSANQVINFPFDPSNPKAS